MRIAPKNVLSSDRIRKRRFGPASVTAATTAEKDMYVGRTGRARSRHQDFSEIYVTANARRARLTPHDLA